MSPPATAAPMPAERAPALARRAWVGITLILLAALVLRLVFVLAKGNRVYFADTFEYESAARSLLAGHGPGETFPRAPLYPAFMALGFLLFGEGSHGGVRMLQMPLGLAIVAMCVALGARIGRPREGVIAGLLAAAAPTLVFTAGMLYPTALYTALLLGITLTARELDRRPRISLGAGLGALIALAMMTDQVVLGPLLAVMGWLAWGIHRAGRRLALAIAAAIAVAALIMLPIVRYYEHSYRRPPVFMFKAQTVLWFVRSDPSLAGRRAVHDTTSRFVALSSAKFVAREFRLVREQPVAYLSDYVSEFVHFFKPMPDRIITQNVYTTGVFKVAAGVYFLPILLLAFVGAVAGRATRRDRLLLVLVPIATDALYSIFFTQLRYRIPVEPHMMVLAALGASRLLPRLSGAVAGFVLRDGDSWERPAPAPPGSPGAALPSRGTPP